MTMYDDILWARPGSVRSEAMTAVLARNWWLIALRGALAVLFAIVALALPVTTMLALALVFSAYMLVDGIFAIVSAVRMARRGERWGLFVLEGIVDIVVAAIAFLWPGITILAFVLLIAAWAVVTGGLMFFSAFNLNAAHGRGWLALGGIVSIIYGVLLIIAPMIGAVVLTWWVAAYALVFGVVMLILAFRLRSQIHHRLRPAPA